MGTICVLGIIFVVVLLSAYPLLIWSTKIGHNDLMKSRYIEWQILAGKLGLVEDQMILSINAMKVALGQSPLDVPSVISKFNGPMWDHLKSENERGTKKAVETIEGQWKAVQ